MAALAATWAPFRGPLSDPCGRLPPLRAALLASTVVTFVLPWPGSPWVLALVIVSAGLPFRGFWTPPLSMITHQAAVAGLDYGDPLPPLNIAWAPRPAGGAAIRGAL